MALLSVVLEALAPFLIDMIIDIFRAERDAELDTGYKKHDHVMKQLGKRVSADPKMSQFENRDVMDAANMKIHETVSKLNLSNVFKE